MGEVVFPREEHANWLFSDKQSAMKTCIEVTLYRLNRLYLEISMYVCTHTLKQLMDQRGHGFEGEQGGVYGRPGGTKENGEL